MSKRPASSPEPPLLFAPWVAPACVVWASGVFVFYAALESSTLGRVPDFLNAFSTVHVFHPYLGKMLYSLVVAAWIGWLAWEAGGALRRAFFAEDAFFASEAWALQAGAGLGAICIGVFLLGVAHLWDRRIFAALMGAASVAAIVRRLRAKAPPQSAEKTAAPWRPVWIFLLVVLFFLYLIGESSPEIFYDALYYHLAVPNLYRLAHRIYDLPTLLFSNFVMTVHMAFGLALTLGTTLSAKYLHGFSALALWATFLAFERRYLARGAGWIAAVLFFSMPLVGLNVITGGTDVAWSFFQTVSALAFLRALFMPSTRWWLLAGFLSGVSASCKYPAFPYIPVAIILLFWYRRRDERRPWSAVGREAFLFALSSGAVVALILLRNAAYHHNPLYPFGGTRWGVPRIDPHYWSIFITDANTRKLAEECSSISRLWHYIAHPWFITMEGRGNGDFVGPLYLMFLPLLFLLRAPTPAFRIVRRYAGLLWLLWMLTTTTPRYGLPALALAALLIGDALARLFASDSKRLWPFALVSLGALVNIGSLVTALYYFGGWRVVGGLEEEAAYLSEMHASYPTPPYEGIAWMNAHLPAGSKVLFVGEARSYYADFPVVPSSVPDPQPLVVYSRDASDGADLARRLRQDGITHIFLNLAEAVRTEGYGLFPWDVRSWRAFELFWAHDVRLTWKAEHLEPGNPKALYVYEILSGPEAAAPHVPPPNPFLRWKPR